MKKKLKSRSFSFLPFLNSILSRWGPRCSHSYMRKQKASNETSIWKPNEIIHRRQYRIFNPTSKKCLLKYLSSYQKKNNWTSFPHFRTFVQWTETSVIYAALITALQTSGCLNHSDLLFHRWCYPLGWRSDPLNSSRCWADVVKILMPSGNNEPTPGCISCSSHPSQRDHFDSYLLLHIIAQLL